MKGIMEKSAVLLATLGIVLSMAGCGATPVRTGTAAPQITVDRQAQVKAQADDRVDISSVVAFVETMNTVLEPGQKIRNYKTSYDKDNQTVYVSADGANIAFKLDGDGNVLFASASGDAATKTALSQGIAQMYIGTGISSQFSEVFRKAEETRWLNDINSQVVAKMANEYHFEELNDILPYVESPTLSGVSDLEKKLNGGLQMPVLTDTMQNNGIQDLTNYYEAPDLEKYASQLEMPDIFGELNGITEDGLALREKYDKVKLETPETYSPDWSLDSYDLPETFSDGSSTGLGEKLKDTFDEYQGELEDYQDKLWDQERKSQEKGQQTIQDANDNAKVGFSN